MHTGEDYGEEDAFLRTLVSFYRHFLLYVCDKLFQHMKTRE
jgi:hypothetical protein